MSPITTYWIILAAGTVLSAGLFIFFARLGKYSILRAGLGFLAGIPLAWLFAKLFFVIFSSEVSQGGNAWLSLKPEEFSFVAGCIGFCLGPVLLFIDRRKEIPGMLDQLALPGCLLAGAFRFGEIYLAVSETQSTVGLMKLFLFFESKKSDRVFYQLLHDRFPWSAEFVREGKKAQLYLMPSVSTPVALLILGIAIYIGVLWWLSRRKNTGLGKGMVFERCVFLLCAFRIFWEMFNARLKFFFVPLDQALCALIIIALVTGTALRHKKATGHFPVWPFVSMLHCFVINAASQFFMDGKNYLLADELIRTFTVPLTYDRAENPQGILQGAYSVMVLGDAIILITCIVLIVAFGILCLKVTGANRRAVREPGSLPPEEAVPEAAVQAEENRQGEDNIPCADC